MLKDSNDNKIGFEISNKHLAIAVVGLAILALGILSFSALGSASLMF